jgi:hypothetical protein
MGQQRFSEWPDHRPTEVRVMLPPFIIDQIRKREELEKEVVERPAIHLPVPRLEPDTKAVEEDDQRGIVVIDLMG